MRARAENRNLRLLAAAAALALAALLAVAAAAEPRSRSVELTYRALVRELPPGTGRIDVWLPYPHSDDVQEVEVVEVSWPYAKEIREQRELGNRILHLAADHPARTEITVSMVVAVTRSEWIRKDFGRAHDHLQGQPAPAVARWLAPDRLVPLDDRIRRLAQEVTAGKRTDLEKARAIYDYVVATMRYDKSGTGWGHGDIYWACDAKRGNCTDFHALFTGLARAVGIPAKFEIGFPVPPERGAGMNSNATVWRRFGGSTRSIFSSFLTRLCTWAACEARALKRSMNLISLASIACWRSNCACCCFSASARCCS